MSSPTTYPRDLEAILARRHDNGADLWMTPDKNLIKGSPFTTLDCALLLLEVGVSPADPILQAVADLIFSCQRDDGRFRVAPKGAIYPCHTIGALNVLCQLGFAADMRLEKTFRHLLDSRHDDGGWRCNSFKYGRGPETASSNPGPTLTALNAFRLTGYPDRKQELDQTVAFLLEHWRIRKPIGPCHYGIGTLFMQAEYPFMTYNLFYYVYVLSFYRLARQDNRFLEALAILKAKLTDGQLVVERVNRQLARFDFCTKGQPSARARARYQEIERNLTGLQP
ncbi:MAG: prenyltransferase [Clostridiaceae bacterium]|jgi:hypothetical protein|nr:prenyltransferase [Clostridiaceae bacterium]